MSIYSITVTIYATAYIRAPSPEEAKAKALALENHGLEVEAAGSEIEISVLQFNDPELPDISLSPAMTMIGPDKEDTPELVTATPCAGEATHISETSSGSSRAYRGQTAPEPTKLGGNLRRKADHFETLLGVLKLFLQEEAFTPAKLAFWRRRAEQAIAKAEAILAGAPNPH